MKRVDLNTVAALNGLLAEQVIVVDQAHDQSHFTHKYIRLSRKVVTAQR